MNIPAAPDAFFLNLKLFELLSVLLLQLLTSSYITFLASRSSSLWKKKKEKKRLKMKSNKGLKIKHSFLHGKLSLSVTQSCGTIGERRQDVVLLLRRYTR